MFISFLLILLSGGSASPGSEIFPYMDEGFIIIRPMSPILETYDEEGGELYLRKKEFFTDLPKEIHIHIGSFLDDHSLLKLSYSSKELCYLRESHYLGFRISARMLSFFPQNTSALTIVSGHLHYLYGVKRDKEAFIRKAAKLGHKEALKHQQGRKAGFNDYLKTSSFHFHWEERPLGLFYM